MLGMKMAEILLITSYQKFLTVHSYRKMGLLLSDYTEYRYYVIPHIIL